MARKEEIRRKHKQSTTFRYVLERYTGPKSRQRCPNCGAKHTYSLYIDVETGEKLSDNFGKCSRIEKCGYFNSPYGKDVGDKSLIIPVSKVKEDLKPTLDSSISYINPAIVLDSMTFEDNFSKFLFSVFEPEKVMRSLLKYKVGESSRWEGSTVFWQIDSEYDARTGKIILYDINTGKRVKEPRKLISWAHVPDRNLSVIPDYNLKQCLFGEHLISEKITKYNIVESEKTAIICDINSKEDDVVWLALGGLELVDPERLKVLEGMKMTFYPDKGDKAYKKWHDKLKDLMTTENIKINRWIEKTDLEEGADLADSILSQLPNSNNK